MCALKLLLASAIIIVVVENVLQYAAQAGGYK